MSVTTCFNTSSSPICMTSRCYERLRTKVINKFKLNYTPTLDDIKKLLDIKNDINLESKIYNFLHETALEEFKEKVPNIYNNGLNGLDMMKVFDKLKFYYPMFHHRGPCLRDYERIWSADYSDFSKFPLFYHSGENFKIYYLLLITISSTEFRPGHWIGICVVDNAIFYYDSLNGEIKPEFVKLLNLISIELKLSHSNVLTWRNNIRTQIDGKHCGVFQLHFATTIIQLYNRGELFLNSPKRINKEKLSYYLETELTQDVIEKTIAGYFFVNV